MAATMNTSAERVAVALSAADVQVGVAADLAVLVLRRTATALAHEDLTATQRLRLASMCEDVANRLVSARPVVSVDLGGPYAAGPIEPDSKWLDRTTGSVVTVAIATDGCVSFVRSDEQVSRVPEYVFRLNCHRVHYGG